MRVAILGDIHGNAFALRAVLDVARNEGVTRLLLTGDFVGYYYWPREVMQMLEQWDCVSARGNHEDMLAEVVVRPLAHAAIEKKYGSGLRVAENELTAAQIAWLCNLPHPREIELDGLRVLLCHGAPWDLNQYVYPDSDDSIVNRCAETGHDWIVMGHTHYPMCRVVGSTTVVNPGSVGQSRNRSGLAHWAMLDTVSRRFTPMATGYDRSILLQEAQRRHPELPYLAEIIAGSPGARGS